MIVFLNIGSNIGNRLLNISRAVRKLESEFGYFELSHTIESDAEGYESENQFLNIGMMVHTEKTPAEVLKVTRRIEREISPEPHRNADGSYRDRMIDIDIIAIDEIEMATEELTLPHPRMHERLFVLRPMEELGPGWRHPRLGLTATEMIERFKKDESE